MIKIKTINFDKNYFKTVADYIYNYYTEDPMNFLFIGPSGFYVKQIADEIALKHKGTVNRDGFRVINQYVTELLKAYNPGVTVLDRDFLKIYIKNEIEELIDTEKSDTEFSEYLKTMSKSQRSTEYILDIFEKKWEISRVNNDEILEYSDIYRNTEDALKEENNLYRLYLKLESSLENILNSKFDNSKNIMKNYDPVNVYKWFTEEFPEIIKKDSAFNANIKIFMSGFFDLTPIMYKVIDTFGKIYEEVEIIMWPKITDRGFFSYDQILEYFENSKIDIPTGHKNPEQIYSDKNIKIIINTDLSDEVKNICNEIKNKILYENYSPEDFGIISPGNRYSIAFAEYLKKIQVPFRYKNDIPLSESKIVNIIMQPFRTIIRGYEIDDMLALIEAGYAGDINITIEDTELYLKKLNLYYVFQKSSLKNRKKMFREKISLKIYELKSVYNNTDEIERISKQLSEYTELKRIFENLFSFFDDTIEKLREPKIENIRAVIREWFKNKIINTEKVKNYRDNDISGEMNALREFERLLLKIENNLGKLIDGNYTLDRVYKIITGICETETYRESQRYENVVEIMNLNDSRFVSKKIKYFTGFTEEFYPAVSVNPFVTSIFNINNSFRINEKMFRRNLMVSMIFSENIIFSRPQTTITGEQILSSPYEKEFIKRFKASVYNKYKNKKDIIEKDPENIYDFENYVLYCVFKGIKNEKTEDFINNIEEIKKINENPQWKGINRRKINYFTHNRMSAYVDCPLKYYYSYEANISGDKNFAVFSTGLIKHAVLKEFFDKYPYYHNLANLVLNPEELYTEIKKITEKKWEEAEKFHNYDQSIIKIIETEKITEELKDVLGEMVKKYFSVAKKDIIYYNRVIENEVSVKSEIELPYGRKIKTNTRIDRIDELDYNFIFKLDKSEIYEEKTYAVIDYKNSHSYQSEQLFLYYFTLLSSEEFGRLFEGKDIYLKFLPLKTDKDSSKLFIKIQGENFILKKQGNSNTFISVPTEEFTDYTERVIKNIEESDFTPVSFRERKNKRFLSEIREKYGTRDTDEKYYDCPTCEFAKICKNTEYIKNLHVIQMRSFYGHN